MDIFVSLFLNALLFYDIVDLFVYLYLLIYVFVLFLKLEATVIADHIFANSVIPIGLRYKKQVLPYYLVVT